MIEPDLERFVVELLDSTAVQKVEEKRSDELTFADACRFWGLPENTKMGQVAERLSWVITSLTQLSRVQTATAMLPISGRVLTVDQIRLLLSTFFHLDNRFERHLTLLFGPDRNR